jgi:hypothetical protein
MKRYLVFILLALPFMGKSQVGKPGRISLGARSTMSLFNHGNAKDFGYGMGGHFRIQLAKRVNTEWFADYLTNNSGSLGYRQDGHIGWSVMYYLVDPNDFQKKFTPYMVAGHCFDYSRLTVRPDGSIYTLNAVPQTATRWTSAVQTGLGMHYNITPKFDISLAAQYMFHFGKDLEIEEEPYRQIVVEEEHKGIEGHLLISLSANIKLVKE